MEIDEQYLDNFLDMLKKTRRLWGEIPPLCRLCSKEPSRLSVVFQSAGLISICWQCLYSKMVALARNNGYYGKCRICESLVHQSFGLIFAGKIAHVECVKKMLSMFSLDSLEIMVELYEPDDE